MHRVSQGLSYAFALFFGACLLPAGMASTWTGTPVADAFVTTGPSNNLTGNNYGGAGALGLSGSEASRSGTGPSSGFRGLFASVLRFDLSAAKTAFDAEFGAGLWTAQSLTLRLATTSATNAIFNSNSSGQFSITWMQDDSWIPGTGSPMAPATEGITYGSLSSYLGSGDESLGTFNFDAATSGADGSLSIYTLAAGSGLLGDLASGSLASFELSAASSGVSYLFNSSNFTTASRFPVLSITAAAVPEPRSAWLLGMALLASCVIALRRRHA